MSATTWGSEDVERRLRLVRRRLNSLTLQHAAYVTFGLALLALSLVLLAALSAEPWGFRLTFWGAVSATSAMFLFGAMQVRRRWMTLPDVARFADRLAQLEDRLSTVITRAPSSQTRLQPVLLSQVAALEERWTIGKLVPRRIARSIFFPLASLCAVLAAVLASSSPEPPPEAAVAAAPQPPQPRAIRASVPENDANGTSPAAARPTSESNHGVGEEAALGDGSTTPDATGRLALEAVPHPAAAYGKAPSPDNELSPSAELPATERLQALIRDSLGAGPLPTKRDSAPSDAASTRRLAADDATNPPKESAATRQGDPDSPGTRAGDVKSKDETNRPAQGGRQPSGSSPGGSAGKLFASSSKSEESSAAPAMPLRLGAFSNEVRMQLLPGAGEVGGPDSGGYGFAGDSPIRPSASPQVPDDPVQRPIVPPEQEAIVKRIFEPQS